MSSMVAAVLVPPVTRTPSADPDMGKQSYPPNYGAHEAYTPYVTYRGYDRGVRESDRGCHAGWAGG